MNIQLLSPPFAVCRLRALPREVRQWHFLSVTDEEISLVCPERDAPADAEHIDRGWRAFRVAGPLDFSLIGILADLSTALAAADVGLFAVSTYDTDYLLVKETQLARAEEALIRAGHAVQMSESGAVRRE